MVTNVASDEVEAEGAQAGYFGVAVTRDQRIRKNMDRLLRLHYKLEDVENDIAKTEAKLVRFGVDVAELYEAWQSVDDEEDDEDEGSAGAGSGLGPGMQIIGNVADLADAADDDEDPEETPTPRRNVSRADGKLAMAVFPEGSTQGRGFTKVAIMETHPWVARGQFTTTSKQGITAPIEAYAAHARRQLANSANRVTNAPVWIYQQTMGAKSILYYVAVGKPAPAQFIRRWEGDGGLGKVKLVATANGAQKPGSAPASGGLVR